MHSNIWYKSKIWLYAVDKTTLDAIKKRYRLEEEWRGKYSMLPLVKGKLGETILISDKVYLRARNITKDKKELFNNIKGSILFFSIFLK